MAMTLKHAVQYALDGQALLFLGSGFSYGAKNAAGTSPMTGASLATHLVDLCGFSGEDISLEDAAQEYIRQNGEEDLIRFLQEEYTIKEVTPAHNQIMSLPYIRVYTTNYDQGAEIAYQKTRPDNPPMASATLSDAPAETIAFPTCVHLNGCITNLTPETLNNEFRLTESSYVSESLENKSWFRQFIQDLRIAKAIIFVGYSMAYDLDIKRHLSSPEIKDKLVFIVKPKETRFNIHKIELYGKCYSIGNENFAAEIEVAKANFTPSLHFDYSSFCQHSKAYPVGSVSYSTLIALYCMGHLEESLFEKLPSKESRYLVDRTILERVVDQINENTTNPILITGSLGCGKTVFVRQLIQRLLSENLQIFSFIRYTDRTFDELRSICTSSRTKKTVLILESYSQCWRILEQVCQHVGRNLILVLVERSSIYRITTGKLKQLFPHYAFHSLSELDSQEIQQLSSQLVSNNLDYIQDVGNSKQRLKTMDEKIRRDCHGHFSEILLELFQSNDIHTRLEQEFQQAATQSSVGKLIAVALFASVSNLRLTLTDLLEFLKLDYVKLNLEQSHPIQEFFSTDDGQIRVRSSIIARELLYNIQDPSILTNALTTIIHSINDAYQENISYRELLKSILSHANFVPFLTKNPSTADTVIAFYNSVRNTPFCAHDPLFWEQFASACIDANRFSDAESCLKTAFAKASTIPGYVPYQVETVQARCILLNCLYKLSTGVALSNDEVMEYFNDSYRHLFCYYSHPDNIHSYIFDVSRNYADLWDKTKTILRHDQALQFQTTIRAILSLLKEHCTEQNSSVEQDITYIYLKKCLSN